MASHWNDNAHGVRRLGFGVTGAHGTFLTPPRLTEDMIQRAFELGVRYFDTGPSYGAGEAERRLGEAMQRLPRLECILSTKVGIAAYGLSGRKRDFTAAGVKRSVEDSLKRLKVTSVEWLFLHGASPVELTDGLFQTLEELRYWGRVGAIGYCGRGRDIDVALKSRQFALLMTPVHMALTQEDLDRNARARAAGIDVIGIEAMLPSFRNYPMPTSPGALYRLARMLRRGAPSDLPILLPHDRPPADDCLRWALTEGAAHRVVITTTRMSHLEANLRLAGEAALPPG